MALEWGERDGAPGADVRSVLPSRPVAAEGLTEAVGVVLRNLLCLPHHEEVHQSNDRTASWAGNGERDQDERHGGDSSHHDEEERNSHNRRDRYATLEDGVLIGSHCRALT